MKPKVTMRRSLEDKNLFGNLLLGDSWAAWRVILISAMGEELNDEERALWRTLTGREQEPREQVEELWAVVGRRGGKTRAMSILAAYLTALVDYSDVLVPGECGRLLFLAQNVRQATIAFSYSAAIFEQVPLLKNLVANQTRDTISLSTGIDLEVRAASFRGLRGVTAIGVIADELAFWYDNESANADVEILNAVRPALVTTGGPLIAISSPHARRGELWNTWKKHYGPAGDPLILVAHGGSRLFNPTLSETLINRAMQRDPAVAGAEYLAQFRTDVEAFLTRDAVEAVVSPGVRERGRMDEVSHKAFVDPSGGSSDAMTLAIAHREGKCVILDVVRERTPPFSPESVVEGFAKTLKSYGISEVRGDRYGGEWTAEAFRRHGIEYRPAKKTKSELYRDLLPRINSGEVDLLDNEKLISQLVNLERRTARGGRESIDHPPGAHDDVANAVAGVFDMVAKSVSKFEWYVGA